MNNFTSPITRAEQAVRIINQAGRQEIYRHARETLVAHLSDDNKVSTDRINVEMSRLDDAIPTVERAIEDLDSGDGRVVSTAAGRDAPAADAACTAVPNCAAVAVVYRGRNLRAKTGPLENVSVS